jgi:hypothetical protein
MEQKIKNTVDSIGEQLKNLEIMLKKMEISETQIEFPGGVITTAHGHRNKLPFVLEDNLRSNISYHLMLDDVLYWFLKRFGFYLTVKEMLIKIAIANIGNIIESVILHIAKKKNPDKSKKMGIHKGINVLIRERIVKRKIKKDLEWVWGVRCKQHFESVKKREFGIYELEDYIRAWDIWLELSEQLKEASQKGKFQ